MCAPDPNAGRREAARQENKKRITKYYSDGIKQWNKEVDFKDNINNILGLGASRARSDFDSFVLSEQGKGLLQKQNAAAAYFKSQPTLEGGRSRNAGRAARQKYLASVADVDRKMYALSTVGEAKAETKIQRSTQDMLKANRQSLGMDPQFGPPTMLPPKDRAGQFMNSLSFGMNVASGFMTMFPGSDIRLKENIKKIGTSIDGHNIYKFKYLDQDREFIGVMAQEVMKTHPDAVIKLSSGYYGVDYSQLDVDFKEVA